MNDLLKLAMVGLLTVMGGACVAQEGDEAYEDEAFPIEERLVGCTPQSAVEFMLTQRGMSRMDLESVFGSKSRVSEFFSGRRPLSKSQVLGLRARLGISADLLLST